MTDERFTDDTQMLSYAANYKGINVFFQTDIDKRIVEAAKEFITDYERSGFTSDKLRKLYDAVQASKPKVARRINLRDTGLYDDGNGRRIFTTAGSGYEMKPFIESTPEVETRCGPTAGVEWDDVHAIVKHGVPGEMAKKDTNAIMQLIADAQAPIEEKSE